MPDATPTLHMLCGKIAAGKSTLATRLGAQPHTVVVSEDAWLSALFGDQMSTVSDYVRCAAKLRTVMGPHVSSLLTAQVSVVLDYHANTIENRAWMRGLFEQSGASHQLHVLTTSDDECLKRLHARNAQGDHPFAATEAQFHQVSKHFVAPTPEEGFNIVMHADH